MEHLSTKFIGRGWKFPVTFNKRTATAEMLTGEEDIRSSLDVLFATRISERIMNPDFGSELDSFLFAGMTQSTLTYIQAVVSNSILYNESRIVVSQVEVVEVDKGSGQLQIIVSYTISATNNRYNYVYPYYLQDATNLQKIG
jgi:phage baseplate assembly protein W